LAHKYWFVLTESLFQSASYTVLERAIAKGDSVRPSVHPSVTLVIYA